jgi:hypothetical protein
VEDPTVDDPTPEPPAGSVLYRTLSSPVYPYPNFAHIATVPFEGVNYDPVHGFGDQSWDQDQDFSAYSEFYDGAAFPDGSIEWHPYITVESSGNVRYTTTPVDGVEYSYISEDSVEEMSRWFIDWFNDLDDQQDCGAYVSINALSASSDVDESDDTSSIEITNNDGRELE